MPKKYIHVLEKSKFEMPETIDLEVEFNYKQLEKLIHDNFLVYLEKIIFKCFFRNYVYRRAKATSNKIK